MHHPTAGTVTVFSTAWCGHCHRLTSQLRREGIAFAEVDIEERPDAAAYVRSVNRGNQTVPTVLFADGTAATNPSLEQVRSRVTVPGQAAV